MICPVLDFLQIWRNQIRRTEQLQGLSQAEASEILGMSA